MSEQNDVLFTIAEREYTAEDAQKKIENADTHIKTIEEENNELRKKVDEYMEALAKVEQVKEPDPPATPQAEAEPAQGISAEEIAKIVEEKLKGIHAASKEDDNLKAVQETLLERFGDKEYANVEFNNKAKELGLSAEEALAVARKSPKAVLAWFGATASAGSQPSSYNTQGVAGATTGPKRGTWEYWQKMRESDPKAYFSPTMARQRMKDAEELGREKFFGKT